MAHTPIDAIHRVRLDSSSTITWPYTVGGHQLFCVITAEISATMERIWNTSLQIQSLWLMLPRATQFHYFKTLLIEELQSTNEIEQVHSTRKEIANAIEDARSGSPHARRFTELARSYIDVLNDNPASFPTTLRDVRDIYDRYFAQEVDEADHPDGQLFRSQEVQITAGTKIIHQGTNGEGSIKANLSQMLNSARDVSSPQLLSAVIEHFMFEHTHPFYDANGRMGRYLLGLRLAEFLPLPLTISLSREMIRQKTKYYKAFQETEHPLNRGEATFFAQTMLDFIAEASDYLLNSLRDRQALLFLLKNAVEEMHEEQSGPLFLLGQIHLFGSPGDATLDTISDFLNLGKQTARKRMKTLEDQGLVQTLKSKPLVFGLTDKAIEELSLSSTPPDEG